MLFLYPNINKAKCPVATKPVLPSIYMHLCVWDTYTANPNLSDVEIADLVNVPINTIFDDMTEDFAKKVSLTEAYTSAPYIAENNSLFRGICGSRAYISTT